MLKYSKKRIISTVLLLAMIIAPLEVMAEITSAYTEPDEVLQQVQDSTEQENTEQDVAEQDSTEQDSIEPLELELLTSTLDDPVGAQGFDGAYEITSPYETIDIIVQFVTPPAVALRLIHERNSQGGFTIMSASYEDQALSAHNAFKQQLADIPMTRSRSADGQPEIVSEHYRLFNGVFMRVPGGLVELIAALPEVYGVFPDVEYRISTQADEEVSNTVLQAPTPIDARLLREARAYFNIENIHNSLGKTGAGVQVAVLDTGIDHNHPEFVRYRDAMGRIPGWEFYLNQIIPTINHGTAVSGCVVGIAPGVKLYNYRVQLSDGTGTVSPGGTIIGALEAAHKDKADVINMSFGTSDNQPFNSIVYACNVAVMDGVVIVVAAGNDGESGSYTVSSPATSPLVISAGAGTAGGTSSGDNIIGFSSRGPVGSTNHIKPDIIAPGVGIFTTSLNGSYATMSGTSFAAPIIAGVAALLLEAHPEAKPHEIKAMIMNTARPLASTNRVFSVGAGFVRPLEAITSNTVVTVEQDVPIDSSPFAPFQSRHMSSLSYGTFSSGSSKTSTISIKNAGDFSRTYTIGYTFTNNINNAASYNFTSTSVQVAARSTAQFNATLTIGTGANNGIYEGYITISDGATVVARLPFAAIATNGVSLAEIKVSATAPAFGSQTFGYGQRPVQTVTITNTGADTITLNILPSVANWTLIPAANWRTPMAAGQTRTFTIRPDNFLFAGSYRSTITISGSNGTSAQINPTFTVNPRPLIESFAIRMYQTVLGRTCTEKESNYWSGVLRDRKETGASVAYAFFFSAELKGQKLTNEQFVDRLYRALFGRIPASSEVKYWSGRLSVGLPREDVFAAFASSAEFDKDCKDAGINRGTYTPPPGGMTRIFAHRMYVEALGRLPSSNEVNYWSGVLIAGRETGASVAYAFLFSAEIKGQDLTSAQFVERLYKVLMGRTPSSSEVKYWSGRLNVGLPREDVFAAFVASPEFDNVCKGAGIKRGTYIPPPGGMAHVFAYRMYKEALGRTPSSKEVNYWSGVLIAGRETGASVAYAFLFSAEMQNQGLTNAQFAERLYKVLMGRTPSSNEVNYWAGVLRSNSRYSVFVSFVNSPEFDRVCKDHGIIRGTAP